MKYKMDSSHDCYTFSTHPLNFRNLFFAPRVHSNHTRVDCHGSQHSYSRDGELEPSSPLDFSIRSSREDVSSQISMNINQTMPLNLSLPSRVPQEQGPISISLTSQFDGEESGRGWKEEGPIDYSVARPSQPLSTFIQNEQFQNRSLKNNHFATPNVPQGDFLSPYQIFNYQAVADVSESQQRVNGLKGEENKDKMYALGNMAQSFQRVQVQPFNITREEDTLLRAHNILLQKHQARKKGWKLRTTYLQRQLILEGHKCRYFDDGSSLGKGPQLDDNCQSSRKISQSFRRNQQRQHCRKQCSHAFDAANQKAHSRKNSEQEAGQPFIERIRDKEKFKDNPNGDQEWVPVPEIVGKEQSSLMDSIPLAIPLTAEEDHSYCKKAESSNKRSTILNSYSKRHSKDRFMGVADTETKRKMPLVSNSKRSCPNKQQRKRCSLCLNHGITVRIRGHAGKCPRQFCECTRCTITKARQLHMLRQQRLTRQIQRQGS